MQIKAAVSKEKEKTSVVNKPYRDHLTAVRPTAMRTPDPVEIIRRIRQNPESLTREDAMALQSIMGNRAVIQLLSKQANKRKEEQNTGNPGISKEEPDSGQAAQVQDASADKTEQPESKEKSQIQEQGPETKDSSDREQKESQQGNEPENPVPESASSDAVENTKKLARELPAGEEKAGAVQQEKKDEPLQEAKGNEKDKDKDKAAVQSEPADAKTDKSQKGAQKEASLTDMLGAMSDDGKEAPAKSKKVNIKGEDPGQILEQLTEVPPTQAAEAYSQAVSVSAGAFVKQKSKTQQAIPSIKTPTGLAAKAAKVRKGAKTIAHSIPAVFKSEQSGGMAHSGNIAGISIGSTGSADNPEAILGEIRSASAQPAGINMTGEADPSQLAGFNTEAAQHVGTAKKAEMGQINNPFGENDIYPEPDATQLKPTKALQGAASPAGKPLPALALPGTMTAGLNKSLAPEMKKRIGAKQSEYQQQKEKFDAEVLTSKADTHSQISQTEDAAKAKQLNQQAGAKAEVDNLRGEWRNELDAAETDYSAQAGTAATQKKGEIDKVRTEKEGEAQKRQSEAEQEATQAYKKAKTDANSKKAEEESKEKKKGGVLGWIKDKLEAVVDVIKKAVNFIFEGLRKAVKFIFDKAKQAVLGIIELGRKLITGLIKGLGTLLKKLVSVVFAKFPAIANKICSKIDRVVDGAIKAVNQIADKLKKGVVQLLNFLASKLDQFLAGLQSFYTKLISTIGNLLIAVFLDVMERIGALGKAAKQSLSHLEGKMWEYLIGVDISQPMGEQTAEAGTTEQVQDEPQSQSENEKLTENDIEVENVEQGEMDPELAQDINLRDGETKELAGSSDPHTLESIRGEFETDTPEKSLAGKVADGAALRANNAGKVFDQIKGFVIKWMKANGLKLLGIIALTLAGIVAAEIITGGAITAALPTIMSIITEVMQAQAIVSVAQTLAQAAVYVGTYLSQGWQKLIEPAAVALATALAMGLVELAMELGFKGIGKGLKKAGQAVKNGAKATVKGVKTAAHAGASGIKSLLKSGAKLVSKSGSMIIRNGKIVIKSLQKGFMKGVKQLQGLIGRILAKFKFKRFKLERQGKYIDLFGEVNPWVLLAKGIIKKVDSLEGRKAGISTEAELKKITSLKIADRVEVYKKAEAAGGQIDFDIIRDSDNALVDSYRNMKRDKIIPGQAHHLNQDAAYKGVIPSEEGVTIKLEGNAFKDVDSPHYNVHESLEKFWDKFRKGGDRFGDSPTNLEYTKGMYDSLKAAGYTGEQAMEITNEAIKQRVKFGLLGGEAVPNIPSRINQKKRIIL